MKNSVLVIRKEDLEQIEGYLKFCGYEYFIPEASRAVKPKAEEPKVKEEPKKKADCMFFNTKIACGFIRSARKYAGIGQKALAEKTDFSIHTVSRDELGISTRIPRSRMEQYSKILGVDIIEQYEEAIAS